MLPLDKLQPEGDFPRNEVHVDQQSQNMTLNTLPETKMIPNTKHQQKWMGRLPGKCSISVREYYAI